MRAVIEEGTGPCEESVHLIAADSDEEAITKVAAKILADYNQTPEDYGGLCTAGPAEHNHTPTYTQTIYNGNGNQILTLRTVPVLT